jgi:hypothetical protein
VTGTADVPAEADLVIPDGVLPIASRAAGPIYAEFHAGANLIGTAEQRGGAIFLAGLLEVLAAGWVLVADHGAVPAEPELTCGCGIPPEGAPGTGQGCSAGCMVPVPAAGDVPAEAVRAIPSEAVAIAASAFAAQWGYAAPHLNHEAMAQTVLDALTEAGWVPVPGPVRTEWAVSWLNEAGRQYDVRPSLAEAVKAAEVFRRVEPASAPSVESRRATEWQPAPESTQDGAGAE